MPSAAAINAAIGLIPCGTSPGALVLHIGDVPSTYAVTAQSRGVMSRFLRLWELCEPEPSEDGFLLPLSKYCILMHNLAIGLLGESLWAELAAQPFVRLEFIADTGGDGVLSYDDVEAAVATVLAAWTGGVDQYQWMSALDSAMGVVTARGSPQSLRHKPFLSLTIRDKKLKDPIAQAALAANPTARWRACRAKLIAQRLAPRMASRLASQLQSAVAGATTSKPVAHAAAVSASTLAASATDRAVAHATKMAEQAAGLAVTRVPALAVIFTAITALTRARLLRPPEPEPDPAEPESEQPEPAEPEPEPAEPEPAAPEPEVAESAKPTKTRNPRPPRRARSSAEMVAKLCYSAAGARVRREREAAKAGGVGAAEERHVYARRRGRPGGRMALHSASSQSVLHSPVRAPAEPRVAYGPGHASSTAVALRRARTAVSLTPARASSTALAGGASRLPLVSPVRATRRKKPPVTATSAAGPSTLPSLGSRRKTRR
jgi:hypothetical protein